MLAEEIYLEHVVPPQRNFRTMKEYQSLKDCSRLKHLGGQMKENINLGETIWLERAVKISGVVQY